MRNKYIVILILAITVFYSAKAEDTIPKPNILDTLVIVDGDRESRTLNYEKWKVDSIIAYKKDFFYEEIKTQSLILSFLTLGYSKHLYNINDLNTLYLSTGLSLGSPRNSFYNYGIPISINYLYGNYNMLELSLGYYYSELTKNLGRKYNPINGSYSDLMLKQYGRSLTFDIAYRQQYTLPRIKLFPFKALISRIGISTHYQLSLTEIQNKQYMYYLNLGIGFAF